MHTHTNEQHYSPADPLPEQMVQSAATDTRNPLLFWIFWLSSPRVVISKSYTNHALTLAWSQAYGSPQANIFGSGPPKAVL